MEDQALTVATQLREVESYSTNALGELRRIIADLRPSQLDDLGLTAALKWYVQSFEQRCDLKAEFVTQGEPVRLPAETETVLFRITQEALTNVAKHAEASHVTVRLISEPDAVIRRTKTIRATRGRQGPAQRGLSLSGWGWGCVSAPVYCGECTIQSTPGAQPSPRADSNIGDG
ncbi:MAG: hypothetical protein R2856_20030 [Caldilineaceae bacterium]